MKVQKIKIVFYIIISILLIIPVFLSSCSNYSKDQSLPVSVDSDNEENKIDYEDLLEKSLDRIISANMINNPTEESLPEKNEDSSVVQDKEIDSSENETDDSDYDEEEDD